jgi:hypothetical protein
VAPALNVTGPVTTTVGEVTMAENVTACPRTDGLSDEVILVVLVVCSTVCFSTADALPSLHYSLILLAKKEGML